MSYLQSIPLQSKQPQQHQDNPVLKENAFFIFHTSEEASKLSKTDFELDICSKL